MQVHLNQHVVYSCCIQLCSCAGLYIYNIKRAWLHCQSTIQFLVVHVKPVCQMVSRQTLLDEALKLKDKFVSRCRRDDLVCRWSRPTHDPDPKPSQQHRKGNVRPVQTKSSAQKRCQINSAKTALQASRLCPGPSPSWLVNE